MTIGTEKTKENPYYKTQKLSIPKYILPNFGIMFLLIII